MTHILNNPVWNALNTGNKAIAEGNDEVKYYRADVSPFAGVKEMTEEYLSALYEQSNEENRVYAIESDRELLSLSPWKLIQCIPVLQMIYSSAVVPAQYTVPIKKLSDEHIFQMEALVEVTKPGPFKSRTIDFGYYEGIFDGDNLVAMAGQRMYLPPYAEISAVCTHPDYVGRGYAKQLLMSQVGRILKNEEIPFLHVAKDNTRAIQIYESLGFVNRQTMFVYIVKK